MNSPAEIKPQKNAQVISFRAFHELILANRHAEAYGGSQVPSAGLNPSTLKRLNMGSFPPQTGFGGSNPPASVQQGGPVPQCQFLGHPQPFLTNPAASRSGSSASQLTIFYDGTVNVYDVSADKAQAIITLAENAVGNSCPQMPPRDHVCRITTSLSSNSQSIPAGIKPFPVRHPVSNNLPVARKQSLHRFLEKRKERLGSVGDKTTTVERGQLLPREEGS